MSHPVNTWTKSYIEELRKKSICTGVYLSCTFTDTDKQLAIDKLSSLYPLGRVNPSFAERMLYLSQMY